MNKFMLNAVIVGVLVCTCTCLNAQAEGGDFQQRLNQARQISDSLISELGQRLKNEMSSNGPESAIAICREVATKMVNQLSLDNGWRVTRISLKPRNAMLGIADAWEQAVLLDFEDQLKTGQGFEGLEHAEIVSEPAGTSFRYVRALETKGLCLACHGSDDQISDGVKDLLKQHYPYDKARGFSIGDLRGAISIKQSMN